MSHNKDSRINVFNVKRPISVAEGSLNAQILKQILKVIKFIIKKDKLHHFSTRYYQNAAKNYRCYKLVDVLHLKHLCVC